MTRERAMAWVVALALAATAAAQEHVDVGRGPVPVHVPAGYDPTVPTPLIVLLHGYSASGAWAESYMRLARLVDDRGFLYAYPDGTVDRAGNRFWNATDACCNFFGSTVDDVGYLGALIEAIAARWNVDRSRICLIGHSNGGFMSYRMACDRPDLIAGIASLAGATWLDPNRCAPKQPVHVLQIHGTADTTIRYNGGCIGQACYPGAVATTEQWARFDGCAVVGEPGEPLDLDRGLPGNETQVTRYRDGCLGGGSAELWSIVGGSHVPNLSEQFAPLVIDHLLSRAKEPPCRADCDRSGSLDIRDFFCFQREYAERTAYADFDGNGTLDIRDYFAFQRAFAEGCP